jgi:hypothetical protein
MSSTTSLYVCTLDGVRYHSFSLLPEWLQELLEEIYDLDRLAQASRINDVLAHPTSSEDHLDYSVNKNEHYLGDMKTNMFRRHIAAKQFEICYFLWALCAPNISFCLFIYF